MDTLIILIYFFILLVVLKRFYHRKIELAYKYKLYEYRDNLRRLAIEGKVDKDSWIFDFYDRKFSDMIRESYYITIFRLIVMSMRHEDSGKVQKLQKRVDKEIKKNNELAKISISFSESTQEYLSNQHRISFAILTPVLGLVIGGNIIASKIKQWVEKILFYPDISKKQIQAC